MTGVLRIRLAAALVAGLVIGACAGPEHITQLAPLGGAPPASSYTLTPPSPNASAAEVDARQILTDTLAAQGFGLGASPTYLIDISVSSRPSSVRVYADAERDVARQSDIAPAHCCFSLCATNTLRVTLVITERATGQVLKAVRSGQFRRGAEVRPSLKRLINAALNAPH